MTWVPQTGSPENAHRQKFNVNSQTFTLSNAKTNLDRLTEKAMKREPVYIVRGQHGFVLRHVRDIDPIPLRPPGYFANCYTKNEIELENRLQHGLGPGYW